MYQSDDISKLAQAMLLVQEHLQPAIKDANNPFIGNDYATLNSVMESCRHLLLQQGILVTQLPCPAPVELGTGHIGLETRFVHVESGQWLSSTAVIPLPKNDPQGLGSALTYARRYSLCAILGIVTEDDDGNAASMPVKQAQKATRPVEASQRQKGTSESSSSKGKISSASNRPVSSQQNLPNIDGVTFRSVQAEDGRPCIVAAGKTLEKKDLLRASGFRWNAQQKVWWKYADAA
ncbi:ERF family protein [uncultured Mailhella sp.]|uniref:ERF family protein n=1 Tax=uncultured Mailhella sp. TaxID=1981031 RepID=UPI002637E4DA|nr:ERF family protein [uncultured Mailhella sp.]